MNGLLHRLAARAAGTALAVRSDAHLPFAAPWSGAAGPESDGIALAPARPPSAVPAPAVVPAHALEETGASWREPSPMALDAPPYRESADAAPRRPDAAVSVFAIQPTGEPAEPPALMPPAAPDRLEAASEAAARHGTAAPRSSLEDRQVRAPSPRHVESPPGTAHPASTWRSQPPLAIAPRPVPAARVPQVTRPVDEPAEVHIHIGRIDLVAVQDGPAPRRRAAPTPAAPSLDAYLAKRSAS
jgi:hypothetical protein